MAIFGHWRATLQLAVDRAIIKIVAFGRSPKMVEALRREGRAGQGGLRRSAASALVGVLDPRDPDDRKAMSLQPSLLDLPIAPRNPLPEGFRYQAALVTPQEERDLVARVDHGRATIGLPDERPFRRAPD